MSISGILTRAPFALLLASALLASPACAQSDIASNLQYQTVFDWYIAKPEDRAASAVAILSEYFMPRTEAEFAQFKKAVAFLIDCLNQHTGTADSEPLASFIPFCLAQIRARGLVN